MLTYHPTSLSFSLSFLHLSSWHGFCRMIPPGPLFRLGSVHEKAWREQGGASYKWLLIQAAQPNSMSPAQPRSRMSMWCLTPRWTGDFSEFCLSERSLWGSCVHSGWHGVGCGSRWMHIALGERLSDVNPALRKCLCDVTLQHAAQHVGAVRPGWGPDADEPC